MDGEQLHLFGLPPDLGEVPDPVYEPDEGRYVRKSDAVDPERYANILRATSVREVSQAFRGERLPVRRALPEQSPAVKQA